MVTTLSPGRFFGTVEGKHATGPFRLVETRYGRGQRVPVHDHDHPYFCLVLRGDYRERAGDREVACRPDTVVFHPGHAPHEDRFGDLGGRCFNLECESSWLDDRSSGLEALTSPLYLHDDYTAWLTRRLHHETRTLAGHSDLSIDGLARALVAAVARAAAEQTAEQATGQDEAAGPDWFREAVAIASRDYADSIGLADVAARVGIHPRHLARTFHDRMGSSLGSFVRRRRVAEACRLIRETDDSLSRIAFRTGFADQSHLTRTFKRIVGTTPAAYRRR